MIVLGSTGSIGRNALFLARKFRLNVSALSCGANVALLNEQIAEFRPKFICVGENADKTSVKFNKNRIFVGQSGLEKMLESCDDALVLNAIVGFAGLRASLKAKALGKVLALANKESLVVAGKFLKGAKISPIDSEHSALNFLLAKHDLKDISRLIITASGGAFFRLKNKDLKKVTPKMALKHPNWTMGTKITIDSATMANKLFEIIEAYHLFGFKNIDALIEPKSLIHAICEFKDGGSTAYFSRADMKLAISQAILPFYNETQGLENAINSSILNKNSQLLNENSKKSKLNSKNSKPNSSENLKNSNENSGILNENSSISSQNSKNDISRLNLAKNSQFLNENSSPKLNLRQNLTKNSQKITKPLDFVTIPKLKFFKISPKKYPIFSLKDELLANVDLGVIINAANEVQVGKFLRKECEFLDISKGIFKALNRFGGVKISALNEVFELHLKVGEFLKKC